MVTWVVVAYVGFHTVTHTVLSLNMCWAETAQRSDIYPLSGRVSDTSNTGYIEADIYLNKASQPYIDTHDNVMTHSFGNLSVGK